MNAIFVSERLENSNKLVNTVTSFENTTINDVGYELNTATSSGEKFKFASDLDRITHNSTGIAQKTLLNIRMISTVSVLTPLINPKIVSAVMAT